MIKVTLTALVLVAAAALAGCASTGGSTVTLSSIDPSYASTIGVIGNPSAPDVYRVYPQDDQNGNPEQGDSLY